MAGRVLTIAESDSSGGSGIQADLKTILALGGYATTAITGITAQNSLGVDEFQMVDPLLVASQMKAILHDIGTDAIKTGILNNAMAVEAIANVLDKSAPRPLPVIVDPSLVSRAGQLMVDEMTLATIKRRLLVRADVLTPNLREAEYLTGMTLRDIDAMRHAAVMLRTLGAENVVLKCGQALSGTELYLVISEDEERIYERQQVDTRHTAGAGCTLASAMAVSMAQGMPLFTAVERSLDFLNQAILHAPGYGSGCGPMNHAFAIERQQAFFQPDAIRRSLAEVKG